MPWTVPPSTRLFWLGSGTLRNIECTQEQSSWDTAISDTRAIRCQEGQQKIIKQVASHAPRCGDLVAAAAAGGEHSASSDLHISVASLSFTDNMVGVEEIAGGEHSASSDLDLSVASRVSFADTVQVREIPKNRPASKRACFYSSQDIAIFELEAFLQDLDSRGFQKDAPVECQEEHKDDYEETRVTGAIRDICSTPGSPVSPLNPRISISPRFKRVTKEANVSDKLRQLFALPFGPTGAAEGKEEAKVPDGDDIQSQGCLTSCLASDTKKLSKATRQLSKDDTKKLSKEVSFRQVCFCNTPQVFSIPKIPNFYKERLFYNYDDFASFEIAALMMEGKGEAFSRFPKPSDQDRLHHGTTSTVTTSTSTTTTDTTPRVSFCEDDPQVIIIPKLQDAQLEYYFYRNGDIAQFRHDAWMEERLFGHPLTSFGCDSKG
jgi:hypothetical protein